MDLELSVKGQRIFDMLRMGMDMEKGDVCIFFYLLEIRAMIIQNIIVMLLENIIQICKLYIYGTRSRYTF